MFNLPWFIKSIIWIEHSRVLHFEDSYGYMAINLQSNLFVLMRDILWRYGYGTLPIEIRSMNGPCGCVSIGIG